MKKMTGLKRNEGKLRNKKSGLTGFAEKRERIVEAVRVILGLLGAIYLWIVAGVSLVELFRTRDLFFIILCEIFGFFAYLLTGMYWVDLKLMIEERRDTKERAKLQEEESAQERQNEMMTSVKRK